MFRRLRTATIRKPLKRLDLNFSCLLGSAVVHWEFLQPRQYKAIKSVERGKAERLCVLGAAARRLRAKPLKPTRDAVPRLCKPLKRLDLNFECLLESAVVHWEFLQPRQYKAIKSVERGKAERLCVLGAAARRLRAKPLKPTRDAVPRLCKPLKRLDLNFSCLLGSAIIYWESQAIVVKHGKLHFEQI